MADHAAADAAVEHAPARAPAAQVRGGAGHAPPQQAAVLRLQRLAGNGAVTTMLGAHGHPGARPVTVGAGGPASAAGKPIPAADAAALAVAAPAAAAPAAVFDAPTAARAAGGPADPGVARTSAAAPDLGGQPAAPTTVQRGILDDVTGAAAGLAAGARDSVLQSVAGWARRMPGYELLCTVLGRDVVAGTPVPRSASAIVNGVLALVPRGDALRQQLQESRALERAGAWFEEEVPKLGLTWDAVRGLFTRAWDALSATDLLDPEGAWNRLRGIFGPPLARLRDFAVGSVTKVAELVFEGVMTMTGSLGGQVMGIVRRAGGVFQQILADPVAFAGNLVAAVRGGLGQFLTNVGTHLRNGLVGWLTGSLGGMIRVPAQLDLRGVLGMAMDFLGITWTRIRTRIVAVIGERPMSLLERGAGIVKDVAERGVSALTSRIAQFTSGLVDTVLGGIREWVTHSVVGAAITRLLSMFNPAGAVVQAIIAVYNTIQFFLERAQQLGALASSIFDSISAIASGSIGSAVAAVENALGRAVPVVLGFLARLIGLGDVATPVRNVMTRVQTVIDAAVDRVVGWIAGMARRVAGAFGRGRAGGAEDTPACKQRRLDTALDIAARAVDRFSGRTIGEAALRPILAAIRVRYRLAKLEPVLTGGTWSVRGELNPSGTRQTSAKGTRTTGKFVAAELDTWKRAVRATGDPVVYSPTEIRLPKRDNSVPAPGKALIPAQYQYVDGHLVARTLGGPDADRHNLAAISVGTNGQFSAIEDSLRRALERSQDASVRYTTTCHYADDGPAELEAWMRAGITVPIDNSRFDGVGELIFAMIRDNGAPRRDRIAQKLGLPQAALIADEDRLKLEAAYCYLPRGFTITVETLAGDISVGGGTFSNHLPKPTDPWRPRVPPELLGRESTEGR